MIGFILADGCLMLIRTKAKRKYKNKIYHYFLYTPRVNVSQRVDGIEILKDFQKRFGGYVMENKSLKISRPVNYWVVSNIKMCREIARMVCKCKLPSPKKKVAKLLYEYCSWKLPMGSRRMTEHERNKAKDFWEKIHDANTFKEVTN